MPDLLAVSIEEQIACVDRELSMRERVYPRWVNQHPPKMTPRTMDLELSRMRAVRQTLIEVRDGRLVRVGEVARE